MKPLLKNKLLINYQQPTEAIIQSMIAAATQSPSGDNAQPWIYQWNGESLKILHSDIIAEHSLNRNNHASIIALGTVLESIRLMATKYSYSLHTNLLFKKEQNLSVWAEVKFVYCPMQEDPLTCFITKRTTDRRPYMGGTLDLKLLNKIKMIQSDFPNCSINMQSKNSKSFLSYFLKAEKMLWTNKQIVKDLCKWLRLTNSEIKDMTSGMSWKNIDINKIEALLFRLIRVYPSLPKILWHLGFGLKAEQLAKTSFKSSAALICFTTHSVNANTLCQIGAMAYRTWLLLNANGFGVQPLSFASSSIADLHTESTREYFSPDERKLFLEGKQVVQEHFQLHENEIPVWMFRTGLSSELPNEFRAPKHSTGAVLQILKK